MTERLPIHEDRAIADVFVRENHVAAPYLGKLCFYEEQWGLVNKLAETFDGDIVVSSEDDALLRQLGAENPGTHTHNLATTLVRAGSARIAQTNSPLPDVPAMGAIMYARRSFFEKILEWDTIGGASQDFKKYYESQKREHPALIPLDNFLVQQRALCAAGIRTIQLLQHVDIFSLSPERTSQALSSLPTDCDDASPRRMSAFLRALRKT